MSPVAREYTGFALKVHLVRMAIRRFYHNWVPAVVWPGQKVDVRVTFTENRLPEMTMRPGQMQKAAMRHLNDGALPEIKSRFAELGITFDQGIGPDGRDWEWDWSLEGPIRVSFVGKSKST